MTGVDLSPVRSTVKDPDTERVIREYEMWRATHGDIDVLGHTKGEALLAVYREMQRRTYESAEQAALRLDEGEEDTNR